jgi:hypothetical protein
LGKRGGGCPGQKVGAFALMAQEPVWSSAIGSSNTAIDWSTKHSESEPGIRTTERYSKYHNPEFHNYDLI